MIVDGPNASFSICGCKFFVCRLGDLDVLTFMRLDADTTIESTEVLDSHFRIIIDGKDPFYLINITDVQLVFFFSVSFNWLKAAPQRCVLFGSSSLDELAAEQNHYVLKEGPNKCLQVECEQRDTLTKLGFRLIVNDCSSLYDGASASRRDQGVIITANLWTNTKEECITFAGCFFQAAKLVENFSVTTKGLIGCWLMERVTYVATHDQFISWYTDLLEDNCIQLIIRFSSFTVMPSVPLDTPIIQVTQNAGGVVGSNTLLMEVTHATFRDVATPIAPANPVWLETELTPAAQNQIINGDLLRIDVDPAVPATITNVPAMVGA
jgi:hypothetical protein